MFGAQSQFLVFLSSPVTFLHSIPSLFQNDKREACDSLNDYDRLTQCPREAWGLPLIGESQGVRVGQWNVKYCLFLRWKYVHKTKCKLNYKRK